MQSAETKARVLSLLASKRIPLEESISRNERALRSNGDERQADPYDMGPKSHEDGIAATLTSRQVIELARINQRIVDISQMKPEEEILCIRCDDPISEKRLLAVPTTEVCIDCAEELESRRRLRTVPLTESA